MDGQKTAGAIRANPNGDPRARPARYYGREVRCATHRLQSAVQKTGNLPLRAIAGAIGRWLHSGWLDTSWPPDVPAPNAIRDRKVQNFRSGRSQKSGWCATLHRAVAEYFQPRKIRAAVAA